MERYHHLPIARLTSIKGRLMAALDNPRCANRDQVLGYLINCIYTLDIAEGRIDPAQVR